MKKECNFIKDIIKNIFEGLDEVPSIEGEPYHYKAKGDDIKAEQKNKSKK